MKLTAFQERTLTQLKSKLEARQLRFKVEEAVSSEVGQHVVLKCGDLVAYLYDDEAGWSLRGHWQPFERYDFLSLDDLSTQFVAEVIDVVETNAVPEHSKGTTAFYFGRR